jgi:hypothetical protein
MRIYHDNQAERFTVIVSPAGEHKNVQDWRDANGNPKTFHVVFRRGMAEVDERLGRYMIDQGVAKSSPIIVADARTIEPVRRGPKVISAPPAKAA